jgi:hypothetical protein
LRYISPVNAEGLPQSSGRSRTIDRLSASVSFVTQEMAVVALKVEIEAMTLRVSPDKVFLKIEVSGVDGVNCHD